MKSIIMSILLVAGITHAGIVFQDDFEADTSGSAPGSWSSSEGATVIADDGTVFGTPNQYVRITDSSTSVGKSLRKTLSTLSSTFVTFSFDMYEEADPAFFKSYVVRLGTGTGSDESNVDLRFDDGKVQTSGGSGQSVTNVYENDTIVHVDVVVNLTGAAGSYHTGESLADSRYDVWVDGALIIDDAEFRTSTVTTLSLINLTTFSGDVQEIFLDNIVLRDNAYVYDVRAASNPMPADLAEGVATGASLIWDISLDPNTADNVAEYQVYLSAANEPNVTGASPVIVLEIGGKGGTYTPATELSRDAVYAWRVDEKLNNDTIILGQTWTFTTALSVPVIDEDQPVSIVRAEGEIAEFTVGAINPFTNDSTGMSYQWMHSADGIDYALVDGGVDTTLTIANVVVADEGFYYCQVSIDENDATELTSVATLAVKQLLAHWTMDEADYVDGQHLDIAGGHNADPNGEPVFVTGAGPETPASGAATITEDTIALAGTWNPSALSGQITVSAWINWDGVTLGTYGNDILSKVDSYGPDTMMWQLRIREIANGKAGIRFYNNSGLTVHPKELIEPNTWSHVCAVFDGSKAMVYVDGELKGTDTNASLGTGVDSVIMLAGGTAFPGSLDEMKIHNYAMSDEEVAVLFYETSKQAICVYPPVIDYNDDCVTDLQDFAIFAQSWFDCGMIPATTCFE